MLQHLLRLFVAQVKGLAQQGQVGWRAVSGRLAVETGMGEAVGARLRNQVRRQRRNKGPATKRQHALRIKRLL